MLRFEDVKVGDVIQYFNTEIGEYTYSPCVVTQLTDHSNDDMIAKYVSFVTVRHGHFDTGAWVDRGNGLKLSFSEDELRLVGHTDLAERLADTFEHSLEWMKEKEVA